MRRTRWVGEGAGTSVRLGAGAVFTASAADSATASALVPIVPVRLLDTREASSSIHTLSQGQTVELSVAGVVPAGATAVALNVTVVNGTRGSFLTLFPSG